LRRDDEFWMLDFEWKKISIREKHSSGQARRGRMDFMDIRKPHGLKPILRNVDVMEIDHTAIKKHKEYKR